MRSLFKALESQHLKPLLRRARPYSHVQYGGISVSYKPHLDGGGTTFGQDVVPVLRKWGMPKVKRALTPTGAFIVTSSPAFRNT